MRPRVHAEKHIVQFSLAAVGAGAIINQLLVLGKQTVTSTVPAHVREGSTISAIYIEMWGTSDDAAAGTTIVTLEKLAGGLASMNTTDSGALNGYDNKKNVLHTFMGLLGPNVQVPMPLVRGWFKIPKGKQRFGIEDKLHLNIHGQSNGMSVCGFCIYKEQY